MLSLAVTPAKAGGHGGPCRGASPRWNDGKLSPDLTLALGHVPARQRPALRALFAIDAAMGDVVRTSSQPMLGAIRLAWWRERLEALDSGSVPAEPRLRAVAAQLLPSGISGGDLAPLERSWLRLFDPFVWDVGTAEAICSRGRLLFAIGKHLLGGTSERIDMAGGLWALVDSARHCSDERSRAMLVEQARTLARKLGTAPFEVAVRPLTILTALAVRDLKRGEPFEAQGSPGRVAAMLGHRLGGRLPRLD